MLAIALPWTLYVLMHKQADLNTWVSEVALRIENKYTTRVHPIAYVAYFVVILLVFPWTLFFLIGLGAGIGSWVKRFSGSERENPDSRLLRLLACWVILPLIIMSFFPERRDRYALPLLAPTAMLIAIVVRQVFRERPARDKLSRLLLRVQWILLGAALLGVVAYGVFLGKTVDGGRWLTPALGLAALVAGGILLTGLVHYSSRSAMAIVPGTVAVMLLLQGVFLHGYGQSVDGRSGGKILAGKILEVVPDPIVYDTDAIHRPLDLYIYLNRLLRPLPDVQSLRACDRDQVVLFMREKHVAPRADFQYIGSALISRSWWDAYLLPRKA